MNLWEITSEEKEFIFNFLRENDGHFQYKLNERIEFNTKKAILVH